jgi:hypothetical protein
MLCANYVSCMKKETYTFRNDPNKAITFLAYILEEPTSKLDRDTAYPN